MPTGDPFADIRLSPRRGYRPSVAGVCGRFFAKAGVFRPAGVGGGSSWLLEVDDRVMERRPDGLGIMFSLSESALSGALTEFFRFRDAAAAGSAVHAAALERRLERRVEPAAGVGAMASSPAGVDLVSDGAHPSSASRARMSSMIVA